MITQRHTQRLVKWLEKERWIHKQQSHVPFSEAKVFKLRDERLAYGRLGSCYVALENIIIILA